MAFRTNNKFKRYTHSPFNLEYRDIKASCDSDGKITLTREHNITGTDEIEVDEIVIPASLVYKLSSMLRATKKVTYTDEPYKEGEDDT